MSRHQGSGASGRPSAEVRQSSPHRRHRPYPNSTRAECFGPVAPKERCTHISHSWICLHTHMTCINTCLSMHAHYVLCRRMLESDCPNVWLYLPDPAADAPLPPLEQDSLQNVRHTLKHVRYALKSTWCQGAGTSKGWADTGRGDRDMARRRRWPSRLQRRL